MSKLSFEWLLTLEDHVLLFVLLWTWAQSTTTGFHDPSIFEGGGGAWGLPQSSLGSKVHWDILHTINTPFEPKSESWLDYCPMWATRYPAVESRGTSWVDVGNCTILKNGCFQQHWEFTEVRQERKDHQGEGPKEPPWQTSTGVLPADCGLETGQISAVLFPSSPNACVAILTRITEPAYNTFTQS